jgi:hypothetical protein
VIQRGIIIIQQCSLSNHCKYKIPINVPGAGRNDFDGVKSIFKGHSKGWAVKIETFLGPEMATSKASAIWAQKRDFHGLALPMARVMDLPH